MFLRIVVLAVLCLSYAFGQEEKDPEFLKGEPQDVIDSFHALLANNHEHTHAQIEAKVDEWVKKQTPELKVRR